MKTIEELTKQTPVFLNDWEGKSDEKVFEEFEADCIRHVKILFASYGIDGYEGSAWVLFEKDGKLYEVNGSHCSCYGLENQWEPEETLLVAISHRLIAGRLGQDEYCENEFHKELKEFLGVSDDNQETAT